MNSASLTPSVTVGTPFATRLAHLDLDLSRADRPALVSSLLQTCLRDQDDQPLSWQRLHATDIARRLQWLLAVCRASGVAAIELHCACPACAAELDLGLDLSAFEQPDPASEFDCVPQPGVRLRLRLPTGADQSRWSAEPIEDFARLAADLVLTVETADDQRPGKPLEAAWLAEIESALEAADPLTALQIRSECPGCEHVFELPVDLEQLLLQRLRVEQTRTLRDIHRLARAYHWTERQILALSPARRGFYLRCIAQGGEA